MPAVMEAIDRMTAEEKIQTMDYLWSQIESSNVGFTPPPWHGQELARREAHPALHASFDILSKSGRS